MTKDDRVIVPALPEWGVGVIDLVVPPPFDCVVVRFRIEGKAYVDEFTAAELQPAPKVAHA